jgi:hypothetical protein
MRYHLIFSCKYFSLLPLSKHVKHVKHVSDHLLLQNPGSGFKRVPAVF